MLHQLTRWKEMFQEWYILYTVSEVTVELNSQNRRVISDCNKSQGQGQFRSPTRTDVFGTWLVRSCRSVMVSSVGILDEAGFVLSWVGEKTRLPSSGAALMGLIFWNYSCL